MTNFHSHGQPGKDNELAELYYELFDATMLELSLFGLAIRGLLKGAGQLATKLLIHGMFLCGTTIRRILDLACIFMTFLGACFCAGFSLCTCLFRVWASATFNVFKILGLNLAIPQKCTLADVENPCALLLAFVFLACTGAFVGFCFALFLVTFYVWAGATLVFFSITKIVLGHKDTALGYKDRPLGFDATYDFVLATFF